MSNSKVLFFCWLALVVATAVTVYLGGSAMTLAGQVAAVLIVAIIKSGLIIDGFMELRHTERLFYGVMRAGNCSAIFLTSSGARIKPYWRPSGLIIARLPLWSTV